jgi:hypothetical protein
MLYHRHLIYVVHSLTKKHLHVRLFKCDFGAISSPCKACNMRITIILLSVCTGFDITKKLRTFHT